ncbi:hypothetical protein F4808DRAFT_440442 [Astrocystis sublimbata]|nr:hypothetical protein F4808DRAFT_440442 [Astrocystis sublimbata]
MKPFIHPCGRFEHVIKSFKMKHACRFYSSFHAPSTSQDLVCSRRWQFPSLREISYCQNTSHQDALGRGAQFDHHDVGTILQSLGEKLKVGPRCMDDGDLVVYPVMSEDGTPYEAQCFAKYQLPQKLYTARRRRICRLRKSTNLVKELDEEGIKIIVSRVPMADARNAQNRAVWDKENGNQYSCSSDEFPPLGCDNEDEENSPGRLRGQFVDRQSSFAEVASSGLA